MTAVEHGRAGAALAWRRAALVGLGFGAGALHLAAVGVLLMLHQRWIVIDTLSLGQATVLLLAGGAGAMAARDADARLARGALAGLCATLPLALLSLAMDAVTLQPIFIVLTPDLQAMLTLGMPPLLAAPALLLVGVAAGLLGAALRAIPALSRALLPGAIAVLIAGVFQELIQLMLQQYEGPVGEARDFVYTWEGLTQQGAVTVFVVVTLIAQLAGRAARGRVAAMEPARRRQIWAGIALAASMTGPDHEALRSVDQERQRMPANGRLVHSCPAGSPTAPADYPGGTGGPAVRCGELMSRVALSRWTSTQRRT
ncbi:MAG: hypothetical protein J0H99_03700 [Rhodospirillales bacterium]|nr:hypothetical protein [Rhodospirillales bacterium]